jgi:hypothetical protein
MNAFHVIGGVLAGWAVLVAILGVSREGFPGEGGERIVAAISILLVLAAISAAIITSASEDEETKGAGESAPAVQPG